MALIITISTAIQNITGEWSITIINTSGNAHNNYVWLGY